MLMQLSIPLNFIGFVYREIRRAWSIWNRCSTCCAIDPGDHRQARAQRR
jgi:ABC-type transport system involved in Fe-S cluster assembly fused permease/ATPase subunit